MSDYDPKDFQRGDFKPSFPDLSDEDAAAEYHSNQQELFRDLIEVDAKAYPDHAKSGLNEALYVFSERGFFEFGSLSLEDALLIWALVEHVRTEGFDDTLRM